MNKPDAGPMARRARGIPLAAAIAMLATTIPLTTMAAEADPMVLVFDTS